MRTIGVIAVLVSMTVLQTLVPALRAMADAKTPLLLGAVVYYALARSRSRSLMIAFLAGILADSLGPMPLGYTSVCFCIVALIVGAFRKLVFDDTWMTPAVFGMLAGVAVTTGTYGLLLAGDPGINCSAWWVVIKSAGTGLLAGLATPIVFAMARSMDQVTRGIWRHTG